MRRPTSRFSTIDADLAGMAAAPKTPQTDHPAYQLAFLDEDYLKSDPARGARIQLEYAKTEGLLTAAGVQSTVIVFGSARVAEKNPPPARGASAELTPWYQVARDFAQRCAEASQRHDGREFVVATGGGPGLMQAGSQGAADAGAPSVGFNIALPIAEAPNPFLTPGLCFNFHYFAIRKMHFYQRAKAIAVFPGGFGTLDELFEVLNLIQNGKMEPIPTILFGQEFWSNVISFEYLKDMGVISPKDLDLFSYAETADEGWERIAEHYGLEA